MRIIDALGIKKHKYRYAMLNYALLEILCNIDSVYGLIKGEVNYNTLNPIAFIKCGLISDYSDALHKMENDELESILISDEKLLDILDSDITNLGVEFLDAVKEFQRSFIVKTKSKSNSKQTEVNEELYKEELNWKRLYALYVKANVGNRLDYMQSTFADIIESINEYCNIEKGNVSLIEYTKTEKHKEIENRMKRKIDIKNKIFGGVK